MLQVQCSLLWQPGFTSLLQNHPPPVCQLPCCGASSHRTPGTTYDIQSCTGIWGGKCKKKGRLAIDVSSGKIFPCKKKKKRKRGKKNLLPNPRSQRLCLCFDLGCCFILSKFLNMVRSRGPSSFFAYSYPVFLILLVWKDHSPHWIVLEPLLKITWPQMCGFISGLSILFLDLHLYLYASTTFYWVFRERLKDVLNDVSGRSQISTYKSHIKQSGYDENWTRRQVAEKTPFERLSKPYAFVATIKA